MGQIWGLLERTVHLGNNITAKKKKNLEPYLCSKCKLKILFHNTEAPNIFILSSLQWPSNRIRKIPSPALPRPPIAPVFHF